MTGSTDRADPLQSAPTLGLDETKQLPRVATPANAAAVTRIPR